MSQQLANTPRALTGTATVAGTITVNTNAQLGPGYVLPSGGHANLVVNDAASLAAASSGNAIATIPASQLAVGAVIQFGTTTSGLVISAIPSGVGITIAAGTQV